jgi:hypothetical protein
MATMYGLRNRDLEMWAGRKGAGAGRQTSATHELMSNTRRSRGATRSSQKGSGWWFDVMAVSELCVCTVFQSIIFVCFWPFSK